MMKYELHYIPQHELTFLSDVPIVYHSHHYTLFLEHVLEDALGWEVSFQERFLAAREVASVLLSGMAEKRGLTSVESRQLLSEQLFAVMGLGLLKLPSGRHDMASSSSSSFQSAGWLDKYSAALKRRHPMDALSLGYAAAATEVMFDFPRESVLGQESACAAMGARECAFTFHPGTPAVRMRHIGKRECERVVKPSFSSIRERDVARFAERINRRFEKIMPDGRGLLSRFDLLISRQMATYLSRITYRTLDLLSDRPEAQKTLRSLLREAGVIGAMHLFGHLMESKAWQEWFEGFGGAPEEVILSGCSIGRALGYGHWCIHDFEPYSHLILRTPSSYESNYHVLRREVAREGQCFFFQGAAQAIAQLAHEVHWQSAHDFSMEYDRISALPHRWSAEETKCISCGDDFCEVVVQRVPHT